MAGLGTGFRDAITPDFLFQTTVWLLAIFPLGAALRCYLGSLRGWEGGGTFLVRQ